MENINPLYYLDFTDLNVNTSYYNIKSKWVFWLQDLTNSMITTETPKFLKNVKLLKDWKSDISASNTKILYGDIDDRLIQNTLKTSRGNRDLEVKTLEDSESLLLKVKHKIIIKINELPVNECDNSLKIELLLYRNVLNNLLYKNYTPHIIGYINDRTVEINNNLYDYLFLEMSDGHTLKHITNDTTTTLISTFDLNDFLGITFQLLYTLSVFNNILLSHNDLHPGNIIIENKFINYSYKINDKIYKLKCKYLIKLFDFDNSSIYNENINRNIKLDYKKHCEKYNICNSYNNNDLYQILYILHEYAQNTSYKNIINDLFDEFCVNNKYNKLYFRLDYNDNNILNNYKLPVECLQILSENKYTKECITINSNLNEEKYQFELPEIKYFNSYHPKLQRIDDAKTNLINVRCPKDVYKSKLEITFMLDIKFFYKYYKYNIISKTKELLNFCENYKIQMTYSLAKKLVIPFIYGIPDYINHILTADEKGLYTNFAKSVKYVLPITIINVYGNTGINYNLF
jgi:hypothetical protein